MIKLNKREIENLNFEISFCEELIKEKPDFVDALLLLGEAYTRKGFYDKGLSVDKQLVKLRPDDPLTNYNLACSYSLIGDINSSLKALEGAISKGYFDSAFMKKDPDLENARKDKKFKKLLDKLNKKKGGDVNGVWFIQEDKGKEGKTEEKSKGFKEKGCKKTKAPKEKERSKEKKTRRNYLKT